MDALTKDFFGAWENEVAAYQDVALVLSRQKYALMKWDIKAFQEVSQKAVISISKAHNATNERNDLMESLLLIKEEPLSKNSLKSIHTIFDDEMLQEKARIFFKVFANTLKTIDKLSAENKELIRTGLELVGDNLEMIADIIDKDRVYSRVGMINQKRSSIILNKQV
ncbi:MAG: flagellar export chaperone FlgN [Candidatus Cloacimonetes bacterium]|nr:flagellar export chaperone FlgN [Candidatus Cloacimonadota bacterium]